MRKRVTLADVAARAGVSTASASMILNNRQGTRLSAKSAERVRAAAAELRYRPNHAARSLRLGSSRTVAFLSADVTTTRFASAMIQGLLREADERDHTVLIAETGTDPARTEQALLTMLDREPTAVILGFMEARKIHVPPVPSDVPVILVNGASDEGHPTVLPDDHSAGRRIAEALADAGHTDIAIVGYDPNRAPDWGETVTIGARFAGIDEVIAERRLRVAGYRAPRWEPDIGFDGMNELLDSGATFTGLICLNDRLAFGAYQAMQLRGIRIPDDVSVVSFDDDIIAAHLRPALTTALLPYEEMGRRAMEMALGDGVDAAHIVVPMPLRVRDSVRTLPAGRSRRSPGRPPAGPTG
ncbi:MAG: LacI family DNA-binding transcriptional regulator [Micropruina sp.]|uniref:LacI family DNA-binding transcriptional regulator n=1 Tax=Micropruina sp. TaxID=2737536 RepID=UPI0039E425BA